MLLVVLRMVFVEVMAEGHSIDTGALEMQLDLFW